MKVLKSELNFIDWYSKFANNKNLMNDKIQFIGKAETKEVYVINDTGTSILYTLISKDIEKDFISVYPVNEFTSILSGIKDDVEIELIDNTIKFGKSKYEFPIFDVIGSDFNHYKDQIEQAEVTFTLDKISMFSELGYFVGAVEDNLNGVIHYSGHYLASNQKKATAIFNRNSENVIPEGFGIAYDVFNFLTSLKIEEIGIKEFDDFYSFKINNTVFVLRKSKNLRLPNLLDADKKSRYNNELSIEFDKAEMKNILNRIKIISKDNIDTRLFFTCKENELVIESKDGKYAVENLSVVYSKELEEFSFILSTEWVLKIINCITSKSLKMMCSLENKVINFVGDDTNKLYIHNIFRRD